MLGERQQQGELIAGERTRRAVKPHLMCAAVDLEPTIAEHVGFGSCPAAAQDRAQSCQKLARLEWFRQIIVGPHLEPDDTVHGVAAGGQHQDRAVGPIADLPADIEPVAIRQHQVEDDDVHRLSPMQREAARSVFGVNDLKARLAEILAYHFGKTGIIFDQEDAVAHDCPSTGFHYRWCQRAHHGLPAAAQPAPFRRCSGPGTSVASASACAMRLLAVSASPICSARSRSTALRSMVGAVKSVTAWPRAACAFSRSGRRSATAALAMLAILACWSEVASSSIAMCLV